MTDKRRRDEPGPIDSVQWPTSLSSASVEPSQRVRIAGYEVGEDLAVNYGFAETLLLSLHGELPDPEQAAAFEAALVLLAPVSVRRAPARAALLAGLTSGLTGSGDASTLQVGWLALVERARSWLAAESGFRDWLLAGALGSPPAPRLRSDEGPQSVPTSLISKWLGRSEGLDESMASGRVALCLLHTAGLRSEGELLLACGLAGIGSCFAEARHAAKLGFRGQPFDTPTIREAAAQGDPDE